MSAGGRERPPTLNFNAERKHFVCVVVATRIYLQYSTVQHIYVLCLCANKGFFMKKKSSKFLKTETVVGNC